MRVKNLTFSDISFHGFEGMNIWARTIPAGCVIEMEDKVITSNEFSYHVSNGDLEVIDPNKPGLIETGELMVDRVQADEKGYTEPPDSMDIKPEFLPGDTR